MANVISGVGTLPKPIVREMFNSVQGHSAVAKMKEESPIPFTGATEFIFGMDKEVDIVAENGPKSNGGGTATGKVIQPIKFEYGMRVSDEFLKGSEEYQLDVTGRFIDGFARKVARGLDIAVFSGLNPRTATASAVVGNNNIKYVATEAKKSFTYDATKPEEALVQATGAVEGVNGVAFAPAYASALGAMTVNGVSQYPEFKFGGNPETFYGLKADVNSTVSFTAENTAPLFAVTGNWDAFRWGYGQDIELKVIEYGNPDNDATAGDLAGHNQVYLRCEAYIGWAILDETAFAVVEGASE